MRFATYSCAMGGASARSKRTGMSLHHDRLEKRTSPNGTRDERRNISIDPLCQAWFEQEAAPRQKGARKKNLED